MPATRCRSTWVFACLACTVLVTMTGDEARIGLPTRALALAAVVAVGWSMLLHPPEDDELVRRAVHAWTQPVLAGAALVLAALLPFEQGDRANLVGLLCAAILLWTYLATWGHRSPARLRWTIVMSALVVPWIAAPLLDMFESTTRLVSEIVYRRLGAVEAFGVREEPWKLFSAIPHSGSLLVVTVMILGSAMCVTRGMGMFATMLRLAVTSVGALVAHHAVILSLPLDDYSPDGLVAFATSPFCEVALAVGAVALLGVSGARGGHEAEAPVAEYVDPGIYAVLDGRSGLALAPVGLGMAGVLVVAVGAQIW